MAKEKRIGAPSDTKRKMTFVMFQLGGSDETLQQGFKAIEQAFQRIGVEPVRPQLESRSTNGGSHEPAEKLDMAEDQHELEDAVEQDSGEDAQGRTSQARGRKYPSPTFLPDLDLSNAEVPFKEFAAARNPQNDSEKYLVVSLWLEKYGQKEAIGGDEVYTCFRTMGWKSQRDIGQPFRVMKMRKSYYDRTDDGWKLTHIGRDAADEIGKGAGGKA